MKISIRVKLFAAMSCLILIFVFLSWLLNSFVLDKYYIYSKKKTLTDTYKQINSIYTGDPENISLELETIENTKGVRIIILDKNLKVKYMYNQRVADDMPMRQGRGGFFGGGMNPRDMLNNMKLNQLAKGGILIQTMKDARMNSNFIILFSALNNNDYIVMNSPVAAIQESVNIANKFFLFTGIITIILGSLLILLITGRFTKPILVLNEITKGMAKLDFSKRYPVSSEDELGQLGGSINSLAEQLERNITELQAANQKLKEDIEKERQIDEMRKEFISSASHELKTPIALIQGYAEGLKVNVNEDEENKNLYCDIITDEAQKMNRLVKQLLELSQLDSGIVQAEKTEFKAGELVDIVLKKSFMVLKDRDINVEVENKEDLSVNADFDRAEQVLTNYINNAINHLDEDKRISIKVVKINEKVRVTVFNSGKHIPEDSIEKIWTSFYKVDKARTRAYGGFGLGLSIVRAIQETDGNSYGVENADCGVEFWFEMDLAQ